RRCAHRTGAARGHVPRARRIRAREGARVELQAHRARALRRRAAPGARALGSRARQIPRRHAERRRAAVARARIPRAWGAVALRVAPARRGDRRLRGRAPPDARALARLAPSQLQIARAFPAVLELEPKAMLAFFARHDPAGYLTAAILAAANARDPSPYVKAAAQTYFRERGIRGGIAGPA